jgi:hypothetical protein
MGSLNKKQLQENILNMASYANIRTALLSSVTKERDEQTALYLKEALNILDLSCELSVNGQTDSNITDKIYSILS